MSVDSRRLMRDVYADAQRPSTMVRISPRPDLSSHRRPSSLDAAPGGLRGGGAGRRRRPGGGSRPQCSPVRADRRAQDPDYSLLPPCDIDDRDGLRSTTPVRSALDIARTARDLAEAVAALELLLARSVMSAGQDHSGLWLAIRVEREPKARVDLPFARISTSGAQGRSGSARPVRRPARAPRRRSRLP